ncbi:MAG TPA: hypothetical protein VL576_03550 [Candidatus Paceibacterota bacterium]|nr:hypothetical protein [Candidatus Paceibacterota bacterium]
MFLGMITIIIACFVNNAFAQSNAGIPTGGARFMITNTNPTSLNLSAVPGANSGFNAAAAIPLIADSTEESRELFSRYQRSYNGATVASYSFIFSQNVDGKDSPTNFFLGVKTLNGGSTPMNSYLNQNDYRGLAIYAGWVWSFSNNWTLGGSLMTVKATFPQMNAGNIEKQGGSTAGFNISTVYHAYAGRGYQLRAVFALSNVGFPLDYSSNGSSVKVGLPADLGAGVAFDHTSPGTGNIFSMGFEAHKSLGPSVNDDYLPINGSTVLSPGGGYSIQWGAQFAFHLRAHDALALVPKFGAVIDCDSKRYDGANLGFGIIVRNGLMVDVGKFVTVNTYNRYNNAVLLGFSVSPALFK